MLHLFLAHAFVHEQRWVSRSTLASTIWCLSYIVYLHTDECISLFVSKVVHASQINATQTLPDTHAFSQAAPHQLFLSAINARAQRIFACTINVYVTFSFVCCCWIHARNYRTTNETETRCLNTNVHICIRFRSKPKKNYLESVH